MPVHLGIGKVLGVMVPGKMPSAMRPSKVPGSLEQAACLANCNQGTGTKWFRLVQVKWFRLVQVDLAQAQIGQSQATWPR